MLGYLDAWMPELATRMLGCVDDWMLGCADAGVGCPDDWMTWLFVQAFTFTMQHRIISADVFWVPAFCFWSLFIDLGVGSGGFHFS